MIAMRRRSLKNSSSLKPMQKGLHTAMMRESCTHNVKVKNNIITSRKGHPKQFSSIKNFESPAAMMMDDRWRPPKNQPAKL